MKLATAGGAEIVAMAFLLALGGSAGCGTDGAIPLAGDGAADGARENAGDGGVPTDGDESGCAPGDGPFGGRHTQLFSFAFVGDDSSVTGWTTYGHGSIVAVADDSAAASNSNPGALKATIRWPNYGSDAQIEHQYPIDQDFSCYRSMHFSVKIVPPALPLGVIEGYVYKNGIGTYDPLVSGESLAAIIDGDWHELITDLTRDSTLSMTGTVGLQLQSMTRAAVRDGGSDAQGTNIAPPPIDVYVDNLWLE